MKQQCPDEEVGERNHSTLVTINKAREAEHACKLADEWVETADVRAQTKNIACWRPPRTLSEGRRKLPKAVRAIARTCQQVPA